MQTEHLFELTYILLEKNCVTAKEMAEHFGVSTRTIYRWVDALNLAGVPVFCIKGKGGGIRISEKYTLDKTIFTENEKIEILSSVQAFDTLSKNTNSTLTKLKTLTKNRADWIQIDFAPWNTKMVQIRDLFNSIKNAILTQTQIQFDYFSTKNLSENRIVEPWKIIFKGQAWYLFCFCKIKNEPRFFKLSRIENLRILNVQNSQKIEDYSEHFNKPENEIEDEYLKFKNSNIKLKIQIKNNEIYRILDEFSVESIEKSEQTEFSIVTIQIPNFSWISNWILSFGSSVKVLEPKEIQDEVVKKSIEITKINLRQGL